MFLANWFSDLPAINATSFRARLTKIYISFFPEFQNLPLKKKPRSKRMSLLPVRRDVIFTAHSFESVNMLQIKLQLSRPIRFKPRKFGR